MPETGVDQDAASEAVDILVGCVSTHWKSLVALFIILAEEVFP